MKAATLLLVKTASEISLKSEYVRRYFTKRLVEGIRTAAKINNLKIERITKFGGRLFICCDDVEKLQSILLNFFGIHAVAVAEQKKFTDLDDLKKKVADFAKNHLNKNETFAVRVSRAGKHDFGSKDAEAAIGAEILDTLRGLQLKVDLTAPKKKILAEIRDKDIYCYVEDKKGLGGLPLGVEGNVAVLFSGKEKDLVAAFLMMKRGCQIFPIYEKNKSRIEGMLSKLKKFNFYREFKPTNISEIDSLKKQYSLRAIVLPELKLETKETELFALPVLRPLIFYPEELYKEKLHCLS